MPSTTYMETLALSGADFGEYAEARTPATFGSVPQELEALRSGVAVYDLAWRGKLVITGDDRIRWMNGMVTSNVRDLQPQHGNFAYILNPQGRIQGDGMVFHRGDYLLLTTELSQIPRIKEYFDRYIIMDDVEITDVSEKLASIGVAGPNAASTLSSAGFLPRPLSPGEVLDLSANGIGFSIARSPVERFDCYELWFSPDNYEAIWNNLLSTKAKPVGTAALEQNRILNGLPRMGSDIGERELPQETGQEYALHYAKGCYIGQEIVERIHSRGNVNRIFSGVMLNADSAVERGSKLFAGEKEVGEITSSSLIDISGAKHAVALGYIRREAASPGTELKIGERTAKVVALPFVL